VQRKAVAQSANRVPRAREVAVKGVHQS
jgi:hypothetical protein